MRPAVRARVARAVVAGVLLALPGRLVAQEPARPDTGRVLGGLAIVRGDIFEPEEAANSWFARVANSIHGTTVRRVIRREVLLERGQPWDSALAAETVRNLRSLRIFRLVRIDTARTDSGLVATVVTRDGWSTGFNASYRSAGGDIAWGLSGTERNLFGTATRLSAGYRRNPDRTTTSLEFSQPRLVAGRIGLGVSWQRRSDGLLLAAVANKPYFSLASRGSWQVRADHRDETIYRYAEGLPTARDTLAHRSSLVRASASRALRAHPGGYLRLGLTGEFRRDDYAATAGALGATHFGTIGATLAWSRARFVVVQGFAGVGQDEDIALSPELSLGLALTPSVFGHDRSGVVPLVAARAGAGSGRALVLGELAAHGRFTSAGLDSGRVQLAVTAFARTTPTQTAVFHASAGALENPTPGSEFDLGFDRGPRSFGVHAFAGDRSIMATAEYRWYAVRDLLGLVSVGLTGFADWGGAWYSGSPRRTGWDAGVGLRLGASRSPDPEAIRFDLGRRSATDVEAAGWVLSVGAGLVFDMRISQ